MLKYIIIFSLLFGILYPIGAIGSPSKLPDTGQTKCYQAVSPYSEIPCIGTGQDGAYLNNPMSYTDSGGGVIMDNNKGLMWQQQHDENGYNWYQASGTYNSTYNPSSQNICGLLTLGGYTDWRLPTRKELLSIIDYSIPLPGPAVSSAFFPNTKSSYYWSSTPCAGATNLAWGVHFASGWVGWGITDLLYVRCVRGEQVKQTLTDNGDGTVTDNSTGLVWQQEETDPMLWGSALSYCGELSLGGNSDWRLPNIRELLTLVDETLNNPALDLTFFPGGHASQYWSSTTDIQDASYPSSSWALSFGLGDLYFKEKAYDLEYCRCVRGGESGSLLTAWIVESSKYFNSIQKAIDAANNENTIKSEAGLFQEGISTSKFLTLIGGFDNIYSNSDGYSKVQGINVIDGCLIIENFIIN